MIAATTDDEEAGRTHPTGWLDVIQPEQPGEDHDAHVGAYADHLRGLFHRGRRVERCPDVLVRWRRGAWRWRLLGKREAWHWCLLDLCDDTYFAEPPMAVASRRVERAFLAKVNKAVRPYRLAVQARPKAIQTWRERGDETRGRVLHCAEQPDCQRAGKPIPKLIADKLGISPRRVRAILAERKTVVPETKRFLIP